MSRRRAKVEARGDAIRGVYEHLREANLHPLFHEEAVYDYVGNPITTAPITLITKWVYFEIHECSRGCRIVLHPWTPAEDHDQPMISHRSSHNVICDCCYKKFKRPVIRLDPHASRVFSFESPNSLEAIETYVVRGI